MKNRLSAGLILLWVMNLSGFSRAAQIFFVNQAAPPGSTQSGASWANAYRELRDALPRAASSASSNNLVEIWVAAGTYKPTTGNVRSASFALPGHTTVRGGFGGTESRPGQRPASGSWTVLSGDIGNADADGITSANIGAILTGAAPAPNLSATNATAGFNDNCYNVVTCLGVDNAVLDNLVITGGNANNLDVHGSVRYTSGSLEAMTMLDFGTDANPSHDGHPAMLPDPVVVGGGIFVTNRHSRPSGQMTLTVTNCVLLHNLAANFGGGLGAYEANLNVTGCSFLNNFATWEGGAFAGVNTMCAFQSCTFSKNSALTAGGAVCFMTLPSVNNLPNASQIADPEAVLKAVGAGLHVVISAGKYAYALYSQATEGSLYNLAKPAINQPADLSTDLALNGLADAYAEVGLAFAIGNFAIDLAVALGGDPNSPAIKNWIAADNFFNQYLTPLGILELLSNATGGSLGTVLHQPSPEDQQNQYAQAQLVNFNAAAYSTMRDCSFAGNNCSGIGGAGYVVYDNVEFDRCWFLTNNAGAVAGGLALIGWNTPRVFDSAFSGNTCQSGCSALLCSFHDRAQIINTTFVGNTAAKSGSCLQVELGAAAKLFNSLVWGNSAGQLTNAAAQIYVATGDNLSGKVRDDYNNAGPGKGDYVATLDLRFSTVQDFDNLPHGFDQYEYYAWNAAPADISNATQVFQQADDNGVADLAGYCNLGEGIRPGAFVMLAGNGSPYNYYYNNGIRPVLVGKGGVVPLGASRDLYSQRLASQGLWGASSARSPFIDIFGQGVGVTGALQRGCAQFQGPRQQGLRDSNGAPYAIYHVRAGAPANGDGLAWGTAFSSLAPLLPGDDTVAPLPVWVAGGSYDISGRSIPAAEFHGGFAGTETSLSQRNPLSSPTLLAGGLICSGDVLFDGLVFTNYHSADYPLVSAAGDGSVATITNCTFANNSGAYAGAIYWSGSLNLFNSRFVGNASPGSGGAINADNCTAINCWFENNSSGYEGGAIFGNNNITAIDCVFAGNNAPEGGAITGNGNPNQWQLYNDTFYGNGPAAIVINGSYNPNSPIQGVTGPAPVPVNCLFWGNASDGVTAQGYDPLFLNPPADNFQLSANSAAIGQGTTSGLPANFPTKDLAGNPRIVNGRLDLGAFAFQTSHGLFTEISLNGATQNFSVIAAGATFGGLQWQTFSNGAWVNLANGSNYAGVNSAQLVVTPTAALYGSQYRVTGNTNGAPFQSLPVGLVSAVPSGLLFVRQGATGSGDGSSWQNAFPNMQSLFSYAGDTPVQVWVAKGAYTGTGQANAGIQLYGGFAGNEVDLSQRNWSNNPTLFTGQIEARGDFLLDGFIVTNCQSSSYGAIYNLAGSATIKNTRFINNSAAYGGPIDWQGSVTVANSQFIGNSTGNNGGAISANEVTALNCIFLTNHADFAGGAIWCVDYVAAVNCIFAGNTSPRGSAIFGNQTPPTAWHLFHDTFYGNGAATLAIAGSYDPRYPLLGFLGPLPVPSNCLFWGNLSDGVAAQGYDPLFLNPAAGNFALSANSPAIGSGMTNGLPANFPTTDLAGNPRIVNGRLDLGALEFQSPTGLSTIITLDGGSQDFSVQLGGRAAPTSLQWQILTNGSWVNLASNFIYQGVNSLDLVISNPPAALYGSQYRLNGAGTGVPTLPVELSSPTPGGVYFVRQGANGSGDGSSWQNAFTNLQSLLNGAGNLPVQVWVAAGSYSGTGQANGGIQLYGGFAGNEVVLSQRQWTNRPTLFTGSIQARGDFLMDGFVITNSSSYFGAIYNSAGGSATINNCRFVNNSATLYSAINWHQGFLTVSNSQFFSNSDPVFGDNLLAVNSGFSGNTGHAIFVNNAASVINCFFAGNLAGQGSAIYNDGQGGCQLYNDTFYGNGPLTVYSYFAGTTAVNCLFWNEVSDGLPAQVFPGYSADPLFLNAAAGNFQLNAFSLAVGAGSTNGLPATFPAVDAAGHPRIVNGRIDLGAYEFQGTPLAPPVLATQTSAGYRNGLYGPYYTFFVALGTNAPLAAMQWQVNAGNGTWLNLSNGALYQGVTTLQLSVFNPDIGLDQSQYRLTGTAANGAFFELAPATLQRQNFTSSYAASQTVQGGLSPSGQWGPIYQVTTTLGTNAAGAVLQWQVNSGNGFWTNVVDGALYQGATSSQLTIGNPGASLAGYQYRLTGSAAPGSFVLPVVTIAPNFPRVIYVDGTHGYPYYTNWVASHGVPPTYDGLGWTTAYPTLHDAFAVAQPGAEIWVRAGAYFPLRRLPTDPNALPPSLSLARGVRVLGGFVGTETTDAQRNAGGNLTILSGSATAPGDDPTLSGYQYAPSPSIFVNGPGITNDSVLDGFTLTTATGGAIVNLGGSPVIQNCMFVSNSAPVGAAMANWSNASPVLINCTLLANSANEGPLYFNGASGTLENCLLCRNTAIQEGGALYASNSVVSLLNTAVLFNSTDGTAGGMFTGGGSNSIVNSILWGNSGAQAGGSGSTTASYSCIQGGGTSNHNLAIDPIFALPAANNFQLSAFSPLLNSGNAAAAAALSVDLAGYARTSSGLVDIGPYQHTLSPANALAVTTLPYSLTVTNLGTYNFVIVGTPGTFTNLQWQVNTGAGFAAVTNSPLLNYSTSATGNSVSLNLYFTNAATAPAAYNLLNGAQYRFLVPGLNFTSPPAVLFAQLPVPIFVNSQAQGATHDGLTWATAFTNLAPALSAATPNLSQLWVAAGTYALPATDINAALYGGFAGNETALSQRNWSNNITVIAPTNCNVSGTLDGVQVLGSSSSPSSIAVNNASPLLQNCVFSGGNTQLALNLGHPTIANCIFSNAASGISSTAGSPNIVGCRFGAGLANAVLAGVGGTMISNCAFAGTSTGVLVAGTGAGATIARSLFTSNNLACVVDGQSGAVTVKDCLFVSNAGNSIIHYGSQGATMAVLNCTLANNRQPDGAITAPGASDATGLQVRNCILWNNYSTNWNAYVASNPSIFAGPVAAAFASGELNEIATYNAYYYNRYTAEAQSLANAGLPDAAAAQQGLAQQYAVTNGAPIAANSCVQGLFFFSGNHNQPTDPLFANPSTGNFAPGAFSPAQDAGDSTVVAPGDLDLSGNPRVFGAAVDLGANEAQTSSPGVIGIPQAPQSASVTTPGAASFSATVATNSSLTNYVWQMNLGAGWVAVATNAVFAISNTANATTLRITPVDLTMNGEQFRLAALPIAYATAPAVLTVGLGPLSGTLGQTASTTAVLPLGTIASAYAWQFNTGSAWVAISNGANYAITYSGNSSTLTIPALQLALNGQYRLAATNGSFFSAAVTLATYVAPVLYVRPGATGNGLGTNWNNAFPSLGQALRAAAPGEQIWVAGATYAATNGLWQLPQGVAIYGGFAGFETNLAQRQWIANASVLVAGSNAPILSLLTAQATPACLLDGFVLTGGNGQPAFVEIGGNATIQNCTFSNNLASAVSNANASVTFSNCLFIANQTTNGGGAIMAFGGTNSFNQCSFLTNTASGDGGAAFALSARINATLCSFSGNRSGANGGALAFSGSSAFASLLASSMVGNSAGNGGGVYGDTILNSGSMVSCLVAGNYAGGVGGGIAWGQINVASGMILNNCTVVNNSSGSNGGGLWTAKNTQLHNSIIWGNTSATGDSVEFQQIYGTNFLYDLAVYPQVGFPVPYDLEYYNSIIQGLNIFNATHPGATGLYVRSVANNSGLDPAFVNPAAGDFRLLANSPAVNNGSNYWVGTSFDLLGNPRIYNTTVDVGAYELQANPAPPLLGAVFPVSQSVCTGAKVSFTLTVTNALNVANLVWEVSSGGAFSPVVPAGIFDINTTPTQSVLTINPATVALNGYQFRLRVNGWAYTTPPVTLAVSPLAVAYVNPAATGNGSGVNWANAFTNLAAALTGSDCLQVWVAQGTYVIPTGSNGTTSFRLRQGLDLRGGFAGGETNLSQRDYAHHPTLLRATNGQSIFLNDGTAGPIDQTAILDGFVLAGATINPAIINLDASPVIRNCVFTNNQARALQNLGILTGSDGTISNCLFLNNPGGGILNRFSAPAIVDCAFTGNATTGTGAGIDNEQGAPSISNCSFAQNAARLGAGIYNRTTNSGTALFRNSFRNNSAQQGGALYNTFGSALSVRDSLLAQNYAAIQGGAIFDSGALEIVNCTVANNAAGYAAGGWWLDGGAALVAGNCILWDNVVNSPGVAPLAAQINGVSPPTVLNGVSNSIVQGWVAGSGVNNLAYDPLFLGEATGDYHLTASSPAVNAGNIARLLPSELDLDGNARSARSSVDLGAYEFQGISAAPVNLSLVPQSITTCASNTVVFSVAGPGGPALVFTWQRQSGSIFTNLASDGVFSLVDGNGASSLTIANVSENMNDSVFRVIIAQNSLLATSAVFTLTVNPRPVIYVNGQAAPGGNGASWASALANLADALGRGDCSDIWIAGGAYTPTNAAPLALTAGARLFGGFGGTETRLAQRNPVAHPTVLIGAAGTTALLGLGTGVPIDNSTVLDGLTFAGSSSGPAVLLSGASPLVRNCVFTGNFAGAVLAQAGARPSFVNCVFTNNTGSSAVSAQNASLSFVGCLFADNLAMNGQSGGAISAMADSSVSLAQCVLSNNGAGDNGGALFLDTSSGAITNSLLRDNVVSAGAGGAIYGVNATLSLINDTVANNLAPTAAGIWIQGAAGITNCILWNNGTNEDSQLSGSASVAFSDVEGLNLFAGNQNISADPRFTNPAAGLFTLESNSPGIDAGDNAVISTGSDLAGKARLQGYSVDMGAYEATGFGSYIQVIQQPLSVTGCVGGSVSFTAVGPVNFGSNFNWQVNTGSGFVPLVPGPNYSIITNRDASELVVSGLNLGLSGRQFRAQIADFGIYSSAASLTVRTPGILYVNAAAGANGSGANWAQAFKTLDAALAVASVCDQVWVAGGTYASSNPAGGPGFAFATGTSVYGGFAGTETDLSQRNWNSHPTVLTSSGQSNVLSFQTGGVLDGFTITASSGAGGIFIQQANPSLQNCTFASNAAPALVNSGGSPLVQNCSFVFNTATPLVNADNGSAALVNCVFANNRSSGPGGAILNQGANLTVTQSSFIGNRAVQGGAICSLSNCPAVLLDHCTFGANTATSEGGAVFGDQGVGLSVVNGLFYHNSAVNGGALANYGQLTVSSSTFASNQAAYQGGACYGPQGGGRLTNSIFWGDLPAELQGSLVASFCTIQGNTDGSAGNIGFDPQFQDPAGNDYQLRPYSPAISVGSLPEAAGIATDLDGNPREAAWGLDLGAYQSAAGPLDTVYLTIQPTLPPVCGNQSTVQITFASPNPDNFAWQLVTPYLQMITDGFRGGAGEVYSISGSTLTINNVNPGMNGFQYQLYDVNTYDYMSPVLTINFLPSGAIYVNAAAPPGGDGGSWVSALPDLTSALNAASACQNAIWVAAGTYYPPAGASNISLVVPSLPGGLKIYGGFDGSETDLSQRNWVAHPTILTTSNTAAVVTFNGSAGLIDTNSVLDGFTITGSGTGVKITLASPRIVNCTLASNLRGGVQVSGGSPVFDNDQFLANTSGTGGGLSISSDLEPAAVMVEACVFRGNTSATGAAIYALNAALTVADTLISGNAGAALICSNSSATLLNDTVTANAAGLSSTGAPAQIRNSIFWNNGSSGMNVELTQLSGLVTVANSCVQGLSVFSGSSNIGFDPLFRSPTQPSNAPTLGGDFHLFASSPALRAGNPGVVASVPLDLDGSPRLSNLGEVDMGAYEFSGVPVTPLIVSNLPPSLNASLESSLTVHAGASGDGLNYQWQGNFGLGWISLVNDSVYSGVATPSLTILNVALNLANAQYRLLVSDATGASSVSSATTLLLTQPVIVSFGLTANHTFQMSITGSGSSYTMLISTDLAHWSVLGPFVPRGNNTFGFTDNNPPSQIRFYRVRSP